MTIVFYSSLSPRGKLPVQMWWEIQTFWINDDKLNFTSHISNICIKASQKVCVLLRLRNLIPCKAKLLIYKSSILPHLTYCHLVWHNCRSSDSRKIERIQERALRAVFNSHSESYENLLVRAELPSLLNRRLQDIIIYFNVQSKIWPCTEYC